VVGKQAETIVKELAGKHAADRVLL